MGLDAVLHPVNAQKGGEIVFPAERQVPMRILAGLICETQVKDRSASERGEIPRKIRPECVVLPRSILRTEMITFFG